jgi:protein ImuB
VGEAPVAQAISPKSFNPQLVLRIGLVEPTANPEQLLELIELHLETLTLHEEVGRVRVRAAAVGRLSERQGELFTDRWPRNPHQLAVLINRLSSRLGHESVVRAELGKSPVPERAVRWKAITARGKREGGGRKVEARQSAPPFHLPPSVRPLLLHPRPQAIEVVSVAPDGPPQFVWLENRREQIVHHVGPERIETLWWRGPAVRRDYYRIATESGEHLWIFRRLTDARWFVHGMFA